ncbi:uncharacterized protein BDR25DRAFT_214008 [Lindgomyces ingoldianus]|uniref:Uncharacterized protein n=1 Tax=Lindgomyces ingoldianus TaxID=673940 RepID=A0ACB6RA87_9PLEO|nr:uncharacterized protein BDR25DRAFT_214008 [Lindgomyces ingoldianus]KAF2475250.1 hypothetical protein BDR25DRAFT_214008 [Lindgomyces ingoldianus]
MLSSTISTAILALSIFASTVTGAPWKSPYGGQPKPRSPALSKLQLKMPATTLPPPTGLQLKFVGLGIGTQNYTCDNDTAPVGTTGALATLYDLGTRLNDDPMAQWKLASISGLALSLSSNTKLLDGYLQMSGYSKVLGNHFFTVKIPTFSLSKVQSTPFPLVFGKKNGTMDAPSTSCPGTKGEGAVPWLQLVDNGGSQGGVNTVYRLETAGGKSPAACTGQKKTFEVPYAAQYWVFGPAS